MKSTALIPILVAMALAPGLARADAPLTAADLDRMSIEDLAKIDVSSVTKSHEALSDAPAAIYVITHDQIVRSGALTLPEILRLAPNLQVYQTSASQFIVTARGFNGNSAAQAYSNKLLVLIDGRSVYSPLYSGVYWDMQDVPPEDIDRIEVISGPGATLWGANAVNGVINIVTRKAADTQGGLVSVDVGDVENALTVQYGGKIGDDLAYRIYARTIADEDDQTASGGKAHDNWDRPQGGFRLDWTPNGGDTVTVSGDDYAASEAQEGAPNQEIEGRNLMVRWDRTLPDSGSLQVQAYYDQAGRETLDREGKFTVDTYDLDAQDSFNLGSRNAIVWGVGARFSRYDIQGTPSLYFQPASGTLDLSDLFVQDSVAVTSQIKLIAGLKVENDPFSGVAPLPSVRLSWKPASGAMLWAAVSRAIRSPTPFDRDVQEKIGSILFLSGGSDFEAERLVAYEVGGRFQPIERLSFSISAYDNRYDDLRSLEFNPVTLFPLEWGNRMRGGAEGVEIWGDLQATAWWRLSASLDVMREHLGFAQGSSQLLGVAQAGDDPRRQASLKSSMDFGHGVTLDGDVRYVGALPNPYVPAYAELDTRLGWAVSRRVRLSLSGFNLLHDRHQQYPAPALPVSRSFDLGVQWRF